MPRSLGVCPMLVLVLIATIATSSPVVAPDECSPLQGATDLPTLASEVAAALERADAVQLASLAVDECVFRKAQWLLGAKKADQLAEVSRGDRLQREVETVHERLVENARLPLGKFAGVWSGDLEPNIGESEEYEFLIRSSSSWSIVRLQATLFRNRWFLADKDIAVRAAEEEGAVSQWEVVWQQLHEGLPSDEDSSAFPGGSEVTAVIEKWWRTYSAELTRLAPSMREAKGELRRRVRWPVAAWLIMVRPMTNQTLIASVIAEVQKMLGDKISLDTPTGVASCDEYFRLAQRCARHNRELAWHLFRALDYSANDVDECGRRVDSAERHVVCVPSLP